MTPKAPKDAAASTTALVQRIAALPRPLLLALDVDGTLAPIVDDPSAARVPDATRIVLDRLTTYADLYVALVTGRDASALRAIVHVVGVWRAVEHGGRIHAPGERSSDGEEERERARLDAFARWVTDYAVPRGARLEVKRGARVIHTRTLGARDPAAAEQLLADARAVARREGLVSRDGRLVVEASLAAGDKGEAVVELMARTGARSMVFAGDDVTDEPALRVAAANGLALFVASAERPEPPDGIACVVLDGPDTLAALLAELARVGS